MMWFNHGMNKTNKKTISKIEPSKSFEELDHRLACGWHADPLDSAQRKRFVKQLKSKAI